jgi:hypothetical protein
MKKNTYTVRGDQTTGKQLVKHVQQWHRFFVDDHGNVEASKRDQQNIKVVDFEVDPVPVE